jgi:hypothetical protein
MSGCEAVPDDTLYIYFYILYYFLHLNHHLIYFILMISIAY